jgi:nicotinamide phosphoribosyltransferase
MSTNPLLAADFYKTGHRSQYPEKTQQVYSNFTPRSSRLAQKLSGIFDEKIVFFGLQRFIKTFLIESFGKDFFYKNKTTVVAEYQRQMDNGLGVGAVETSHIEALHNLGYLPISIKALPEGSLVDIQVPVLTITNTHPDFFWLPNYLESVMSAELWKPTTTATTAYQYRKLLEQYAEKTGANKDFIMWQGHDFSMRGLSGVEDCAMSGGGHLLSFFGTDSIPAIEDLERNYHGRETFVGGSVPATEHSVMCMGGEKSEIETFRRLINDVYPSGVVSIVSDSWDYWKVITEYAVTLKDDILARKENALGLAKVVFRPDSGDPVKIIAGLTYFNERDYDRSNYENLYPSEDVVEADGKFYEYEIDCEYGYGGETWGHRVVTGKEVPDHEVKGSIECLWDIFGGTVNAAGYKELNPRVGLIYGDSITLERAQDILQRLEAKGFASSNVVFGIGSYTYQYVTRDSYGFAMKATFGVVDGEDRVIFKDPKTGEGKKSAKGLLRVEKENGKFVLYDNQTREQEAQGELKEVFRDGVLIVDDTLAAIRTRLHGG